MMHYDRFHPEIGDPYLHGRELELADSAVSFYAVWPCVVCLLVVFGLAATPVLSWADSPPTQVAKRLTTLDGVRGLLALAVVFHHIAYYPDYLRTGRFINPPSRFYTNLGPLGVSMFFMITGYLFWARMLRDEGQTDWIGLYVGRVFRIGPLYLVAVSAMLVIVFSRSRFHLEVPALRLVSQLAHWLLLGVLDGRSANGDANASLLLAGVTWSIQWEWFFYLSLPVLAFVARPMRRAGRRNFVFLMLAYLGCLMLSRLHLPVFWNHEAEKFVALFLVGMMAAALHAKGIRPSWGDRGLSVVALLLALPLFFVSYPYGFGPGLLLGGIFYLIASGCTLFGLLTCRPARRLGDVSYGIYLLQGLVLFAVFQASGLKEFALSSALRFWSCGLASCVLLVLLATLAHVAIEGPGIQLGRRVRARVSRLGARS